MLKPTLDDGFEADRVLLSFCTRMAELHPLCLLLSLAKFDSDLQAVKDQAAQIIKLAEDLDPDAVLDAREPDASNA